MRPWRVVTHAAVANNPCFGGMQVATRGVDAQRPSGLAVLLPGGQTHRATKKLAYRSVVNRLRHVNATRVDAMRSREIECRRNSGSELWKSRARRSGFGCPPGIRTPISRSRICCPTIERGGNSRRETRRSATCDSMGEKRCGQYRRDSCRHTTPFNRRHPEGLQS